MKRIVLKIGSQGIIDRNGFVYRTILSEIMDQVFKLKKLGYAVLIVSSGACALGRSLLKKNPHFLNSDLEQKVAASLGQPTLLNYYQHKSKENGFLCSQILLTKDNFRTRKHYLEMMYLLEGLLYADNIIPIINENDAITDENSMFSDNDELAGLLASQIRADKLVIMTNVDGVYDKDPTTNSSAKLIKKISAKNISPVIGPKKSVLGRGGMKSKVDIAIKVAKLGIETIVMSVDKRDLLCDLENENIGTRITSYKNVSSFKRWLSFSKGVGGVYINKCAKEILQDKSKAISLLPVGITEIYGKFKKNDVIYVFDENHKILAVGVSSYSSSELLDYIGKNNQPILIHYNQMYIY